MKTIKIAPDLDEITVSGNVVSTEFNGLRIRYIMAVETIADEQKDALKSALQTAIALCSKTHQLVRIMDECVQIAGRPAGRVEVERIAE